MIFIKLKAADRASTASDYYYINPMFIVSISKYFDEHTYVSTMREHSYQVEESPEEVMELIKESGYADILEKAGLTGLM